MLVVEDEPALLETIAFQLRAAGYDPLTAADGVSALRLAREAQPDVVVLDLLLPRLSGFEVLRLLRREASTPIIVLSALSGEADKVTALKSGADDYVTKPFSFRELLARIDLQIQKSGGGSAPATAVLVDGAIEVNTTRHEVRKAGELVPLTPREFDLLVYLMRHAGLVRSRDAILEAVWGGDYHGGTRTVDVHVYGLRRRLEDDPRRPARLLTERSYGYKWAPSEPRERPQTSTREPVSNGEASQ